MLMSSLISPMLTFLMEGFAVVLAVLVIGASQSRQRDKSESDKSCKSPTAVLSDDDIGRISIVTVNTKEYHSDVLTGLHEMSMAAFESQYIDRDTYSTSAEDIEVQSYFLDDLLTNLSPPRNCMPPDVLFHESRHPVSSESEKSISWKLVSFGYQSSMLMVFLSLLVVKYMSAPTMLRYFVWSKGVPLKSASRGLVAIGVPMLSHESLFDFVIFLVKELKS
ncbi:hypothetical protein Tco_0904253 [Tanacetum coccineum]